jgi:hypothetical protein
MKTVQFKEAKAKLSAAKLNEAAIITNTAHW